VRGGTRLGVDGDGLRKMGDDNVFDGWKIPVRRAYGWSLTAEFVRWRTGGARRSLWWHWLDRRVPDCSWCQEASWWVETRRRGN
jgi:hypothetical protein